jgi:hypothetical protein
LCLCSVYCCDFTAFIDCASHSVTCVACCVWLVSCVPHVQSSPQKYLTNNRAYKLWSLYLCNIFQVFITTFLLGMSIWVFKGGMLYRSWLRHYAIRPEGRGSDYRWGHWIFQLT